MLRLRPALVLAVLALLLAPAAATDVPEAAAPFMALEPALRAVERPAQPLPAHAPVPQDASGLGPGSLLYVERSDGAFTCTANFVWAEGARRFLGTAGHCLLPAGATATHGAGADNDASATRVWACATQCVLGGSAQPRLLWDRFVEIGPVAYARQTGPGGVLGNDFGLVEVPAGLHGSLRSHLPVWRGPTGTGDVARGQLLCMYGHASGLGEAYPTKARMGTGLLTSPGGSWQALLPASLGDSGAPVVACGADGTGLHGRAAVGIFTHMAAPFLAGTTIPRAVGMAAEAGLTVVLLQDA